MIVIYAEKASLAKAIAAALKAGNRIAHPKEPTIGHYEFTFKGEKAILCHGVGHLCGLADAKDYGEQFAKWDLNVYPCIPDKYKVIVKKDTKTCFEYVKGFFDKADTIINATDPDREGELIFAYIYEAMHCTKKWQRVWIEDLTPQKIQYAFAHLKSSSEVVSIQQAGRARGIADWICGINLTIAATQKMSAKEMLSVGRVQTPVLAMVVEREKKINGHIRTPFWRLLAEFQTDNGSFTAEYEKGIFDNEQQAKSLLSKCVGNGTVTAKTVKKRTVGQPVLFNATQLQATAGKKLGWDLDKTVKVMQDLYEHKFMSYPRTSSEHLTVAMQPEVTATLRKLFLLPEYSQYALPENEWQAYSKRHFDDSKVDSHPAIVPTMNVPKSLSEIPSEDERQLYDLLVKSLIRIVYPKAEIEDTTVLLDVNGNTFKATGSVITNNGWYAVDALPDKRATLPPVSEGESYKGKYELKQGFTEPPKPYTEPDLITAMETAGKHLEDEEARALMKAENKGLGTPATRAGIINALFHNGYLTKQGKSIMPTAKGVFLIEHLPIEELKSPEMTGQWEKRLHDIAERKEDYQAFVSAMEQNVRNWYSAVVSSADTEKYLSDEDTLSCPFCGARVIKKYGYFCSAKRDTGCPFSVGKEYCGKTISDAQAIRLIEKGKTTLIKGFKRKDGKGEFDAYLVVDKAAKKIKFEFLKKKS